MRHCLPLPLLRLRPLPYPTVLVSPRHGVACGCPQDLPAVCCFRCPSSTRSGCRWPTSSLARSQNPSFLSLKHRRRPKDSVCWLRQSHAGAIVPGHGERGTQLFSCNSSHATLTQVFLRKSSYETSDSIRNYPFANANGAPLGSPLRALRNAMWCSDRVP